MNENDYHLDSGQDWVGVGMDIGGGEIARVYIYVGGIKLRFYKNKRGEFG